MSASLPTAPRRFVPLYDPASGLSWNERMSPGDFAVHFSGVHKQESAAQCAVLGSLPEAEAFAQEAVRQNTILRCRIYSHEGFVGAPVREFHGADFKTEGDLSTKFRRWGGGGLLGAGLLLIAFDWSSGFSLSWPALVGSRLVIPGLVLLATEVLVLLNARQKLSQRGKQQA
jgi:hypothetical protein